MKFRVVESSARSLKRKNLKLIKAQFPDAENKYFIQHHLDGNSLNSFDDNVIYIRAESYKDAELIHNYIHYKRFLDNFQFPLNSFIYEFNPSLDRFEERQVTKKDLDRYIRNLDAKFLTDDDKVIFMSEEE